MQKGLVGRKKNDTKKAWREQIVCWGEYERKESMRALSEFPGQCLVQPTSNEIKEDTSTNAVV
jgi:hypothetical protein